MQATENTENVIEKDPFANLREFCEDSFSAPPARKIHYNGYVIKSNSLVEALYRDHRGTPSTLGVVEYKIILAMLAQARMKFASLDDLRNLPEGQHVVVDIPRGELVQLCQHSDNLKGRDLHEALAAIRSEVITIKDAATGAIDITGWFSAARYYPEDGRVRVQIDPGILPHIFNGTVLSLRGFTKFHPREVRTMRSIRTIRVYEHIAMNEFKRIWRISVEDFRRLLGISGDKYRRFSQFRKDVIDHIVNEINSAADSRLRVKFEFDRDHTRRARYLVFHISVKGHDGGKVVIPDDIFLIIPPRLRKNQEFIGCIKYEIAFNSAKKNYTDDQLRNIVSYSIVNGAGMDDMATWLKHCFENELGKDDDDYVQQYTGPYTGHTHDIKVMWANVPDTQNNEMWTAKDGSLDLGKSILPAEVVKEFLREGKLVRVYG